MTNQNNDIVFTIVIAVYNNVETIERCIKSVIEQTYNNIQLIIIDGQSNDGTVSFLEKYDKQIDYWISEPDSGVYNAWNKALQHIKGDWVVFLGADDLLFSVDVFFELEKCIPTSVQTKLFYSKVMMINKNGGILYELGTDWDVTKHCISQHMCMPHQGVFHHRELFEQYGGFNEKYPIVADYEFIRRVLKDHTPVFVNTITSKMQIGGLSSKPLNALKVINGYYQVNRLYGSFFPGWKLTTSYIIALIKYIIIIVLGVEYGNRIISSLLKKIGKPDFHHVP